MRYALALLLTLALVAGASAQYLGEFDHGDQVAIHAVLNDNGTAADSVSGDSIMCIVMFESTALETLSMTAEGASLPLLAAYSNLYTIDTTGCGYGSYWAVLWAVDVGAGTRDPVGEVSWTVFPRAASATGVIDSVGVVGRADSTRGLDSAIVSHINSGGANSVWAKSLFGVSWTPGTAAFILSHALREPLASWYLGEYQQDDSLTVGGPFNGTYFDSVYATIFWRTEAIDTVKLTETALGFYARIEADTTGGGWGDWHTLLEGYLSGVSTGWRVRAQNTWSLRDYHAYAAETAESADVHIYDPPDSTVALVFRDSLYAWADSFKADSAYAMGFDSAHVYISDRMAIAGLGAESTWADPMRSLPEAEYREIADTVAVVIAALDTIAYVGTVGTVLEVETTLVAVYLDSGRVMDRVVHADTAAFLDTCRAAGFLDSLARVGYADSLGSGARIHNVDKTAHCDSVTKTATADTLKRGGRIALVDRVTTNDSTTAAGRLQTAATVTGNVNGNVLGYVAMLLDAIDSLQAELADEAADSSNARIDVPGITATSEAIRDTLIAHRDTFAVSDLDSIGKVGWVGVTDSAGVLEKANYLVLCDTLRVAGHLDSGGAIGVVGRTDSLVRGALLDLVSRVSFTDSAATLGELAGGAIAAVADTILGRPIDLGTETLSVAATLAHIDTSIIDSVGGVARVELVAFADSLRALHKADTVAVLGRALHADTAGKVGIVSVTDSAGVTGRTYNIDHLDSVDACGITWVTLTANYVALFDSGRVVATALYTDSAGRAGHLDTADAVALTHEATHVTTVDSTAKTLFADSLRKAGDVEGITVATITSGIEGLKAGGEPWLTVLNRADSAAVIAADSLDETIITTLAHTGDAMTLAPADKAILVDSIFYLELDTSYHYPSVGNILWNNQKDSLATIAQIAKAEADSVRALLVVSEIKYDLDTLIERLGQTGDSALCQLAENIRNNLSVVMFSSDDASMVAESLLSQSISDSAGYPAYDSSTVGGALWEAGPERLYRTFHAVIDTATIDTAATPLGAYRTGSGLVPAGACAYVYLLADSGWANSLSKDCDLGPVGAFHLGVRYQPPDTVYYRVRFHAPGYVDEERIVRYPQP